MAGIGIRCRLQQECSLGLTQPRLVAAWRRDGSRDCRSFLGGRGFCAFSQSLCSHDRVPLSLTAASVPLGTVAAPDLGAWLIQFIFCQLSSTVFHKLITKARFFLKTSHGGPLSSPDMKGPLLS